MKVIHFQRRRPPGKFSLEGYFQRVRQHLACEIEISVRILPFLSRGVVRRVLNMITSAAYQGDINHITGDVHYVALLLCRKRTVLTVPDCEILTRLAGWKRSIVKLFWFTLPARRVAVITVISEESRRQLVKHVALPAEMIRVIPVSVSELFQPAPRQFNSDCPRILQVGTKANKNVERLAAALRGIRCHLEIVGQLTPAQKDALTSHGIQFTNYTELTDQQIVNLYHAADIISFVSTHEGFGMPIVEAQCVERVCITSNCSSMPEVAGDGACLVDPFDVESIRRGFEQVISRPELRQTIISNGRRNRMRFNTERIAQQYRELYDELYQQAVT